MRSRRRQPARGHARRGGGERRAVAFVNLQCTRLRESARAVYFVLYPRDAFWIWPVFASCVKRVETLAGLRFRPLATSPAVLSGCLARNSMMAALVSL